MSVFATSTNRVKGDRQTVLLTGAGGFLGGYLSRALVASGFDVTGVDVAWRSDALIDNRFTAVTGDVKDTSWLRAQLASVDYLIAAAALVGGVSYMDSHPFDILAENDRITASTCEAAMCARRTGAPLKQVVYISSSMVFERATQFPTIEGAQLKLPPPSTTYGFQKLAVEYYARAAWEEYGVPYTIIRPFNCVGVGDRPGWEERDPHGKYLARSHVLPDLAWRITSGSTPLILVGSGLQTRTFLHAKDFAAAVSNSIGLECALNEDYNIGGGRRVSIRQLAELVWFRAHGSTDDLVLEVSKAPPKDVTDRAPDVSKARQALGLIETVSLEETIDEVLEEVRKYHS